MNRKIRFCLVFGTSILLGLIIVGFRPEPLAEWGRNGSTGAPKTTKQHLVETYGTLPLSFEANRGQTDCHVKFLSRQRGYGLFLTGNEAVLALRKPSVVTAPPSVGKNLQFKELLPSPKTLVAEPESRTPRPQPLPPTVVRMKLVGANPKTHVVGLDELPGQSNYFIGNDPKKWRTNVPTYAKVRYKDVYPGVDLVFHGNQRQLEYDFVVAPGADPRAITLEVKTQRSELDALRGQTETHARIDAHGDLVLPSEGGEVLFHKPLVYQPILDSGPQTSRSYIEGRYVIREGEQIGFEVATYDASKALIIDPVLSYSTYLGGSMDDFGNAITVDSSKNVYVTGGTTSINFPTTSGVVQTGYAGADGGYQSVNGDVFVTKLTPGGSALVYSTYLGGSGDDNAYGIVVDSARNVYLTGGTNSSNFPVTPGAYQPSSSGLTDLFVTKLNPSGSSLLYSTHIGVAGEGIRGFGIAVDSLGNAYITGNAGPGFPTTPGAYKTGTTAFTNGYVLKLDPTGSTAAYSTLLGGSNIDYGESIAVDTSGNAYVTGYASSVDFPTTVGAFQANLGGGSDAFVTVLNPTGSGLLYSTFLGGTANDEGFSIAVDSLGKAYLTGVTASSNFPTTKGAFQTTFGGGNTDAFIVKLDPTQSGSASLLYSTFLGGSGDENFQNFLRDILAVDGAGNAYVTGTTTSTNFPTANPIQATPGGGFDAYVAKLNAAGSGLIYSTYLGGSGDDFGRGIAVDSSRNVYVTGQTSSANFPITSNAFQAVFGGSTDAFVTKIASALSVFTVRTTAGGFVGDGRPATNAALYWPLFVAQDGTGNLYVTELFGQRIRKITPDGFISTYAGTGIAGYNGDGIAAKSAMVSRPTGLTIDPEGNLVFADSGNNRVRKIDHTTGKIETIAGNGTPGYVGDGGPATLAALNAPWGVTYDQWGNLYVIDINNEVVRKVDDTGTITTYAGNGAVCPDPTTPCGDGGPATSASLNLPRSLAVDTSGNLYIADTFDHKVREVNAAGTISTVAGTGFGGFSGDGGPATKANIGNPRALAFRDGTLYISNGGRVRIRSVAAGTINTYAGSQGGYDGDGNPLLSSEFGGLTGLLFTPSGDLLIADSGNNRVRKASGGVIKTVAGGYTGDNQTATAAALVLPEAIAFDKSGNYYVAESSGNRIRKVDTTETITTVAGTGITGYSGDGGPGKSATLSFPLGVVVDSVGSIYIADAGNGVIRKLDTFGKISTFAADPNFNFLGVMAIDSANNLYVVDQGACVVWKVSPAGAVSVVAGVVNTCGYNGDNISANTALLDTPLGVALDSNRNIWIADSQNNRVRKVTISTGQISTLAGNGTCGYLGDGGPATTAELCFPQGVAVPAGGTFYIADTNNLVIRKVAAGKITTYAGSGSFLGYNGEGLPALNTNFDDPVALTLNSDDGVLYVVDDVQARVRKVAKDE
jgi:sugar lactone lactonase YvrE